MGFIKRMSVPAGLPGSHPVQLRPRDLLDLLQITFPLSQQIVGWSKGNEYPHPFCTGHFFYAPVHWTDDGCSFSMELIIPAVWSQSLQVQPSGAGWRRNKCQDCSWNVTSSLAHKRGLCKAGQRYSFWERGTVILHLGQGTTIFFPNLFFAHNHLTLPMDDRFISTLATFSGTLEAVLGTDFIGSTFLSSPPWQMPQRLQFPCARISVFMSQLEILDLNPWFIFTPISSASVREFRRVFKCTEMSKKLKKRQIFHISQLKTNYNCAFQQTSDCRLIFSYETETEVNEANCVYQHFWTKEKKPTQFWREFFVRNKLGKIATVVSAFPKTA